MAANTKVALTLSNSIIGVSILAMPFCMKQCGIVLGVLMLSLSSLLTRFTCHLLLKSARVSRTKTFEFVALHTFGPIGKLAVELNIIGFMLGILISFFVVIGDLGPAIVTNALNINNTETLRSVFLVFVGLGIALPFAMLREVKSLAQISTLSILFYMILSLNTAIEALPVIWSGSWIQRIHWWQPAGILHSLPIFSLALSCQTQIFEIYDTLPDPSLKHMNAVVKLAVHICAALYFMMGFFGYIANHEQNFSGNILLSSSPGFVTEVMKLFFVISVALSFPLVVLPCRTSIHSLLFKRAITPFDVGNGYISEARFKGITITIVISTLIIGILCPNIELVLEFIGATIGILICIIVPAITFIQLTPKSTFEKWGAQFVFITGIVLLVSCTWVSFDPVTVSDKNRLHSMENNEIHPKDYSQELKLVLPELKSYHFDDEESINKPIREETIVPIVKSASTSSMKPPPPPVAKEKEASLKKNSDYLSMDAKIEDIKRQEPPVPQEPDESPNEETVGKSSQEEDQNKDKANAEVVNEDTAVKNIEKQSEQNGAIETRVQNPQQMMIQHEELLKKMELQQEEQNKFLKEQREFLKELRAHGMTHSDTKENTHGIVANQDSKQNGDQNAAIRIELPASNALQETDERVQPLKKIIETITIENVQDPSVENSKDITKRTPDNMDMKSVGLQEWQSGNRTILRAISATPEEPTRPLRKYNSSKLKPAIKIQPDLKVPSGELVQSMKSAENNGSQILKVTDLKVPSGELVQSKKSAENNRSQILQVTEGIFIVNVPASIPETLNEELQPEQAFQPEPISKVVQPVDVANDIVGDRFSGLVMANGNVNFAEPIPVMAQPVVPNVMPTVSTGKTSVFLPKLDRVKSADVLNKDEDTEGKRLGRDLKFSA